MFSTHEKTISNLLALYRSDDYSYSNAAQTFSLDSDRDEINEHGGKAESEFD
jgi:hypothetical protein